MAGTYGIAGFIRGMAFSSPLGTYRMCRRFLVYAALRQTVDVKPTAGSTMTRSAHTQRQFQRSRRLCLIAQGCSLA